MSIFSYSYEEHIFIIERDKIQNIFGMDVDDNGLVESIIEDTPAYNSGIKVYDQIIAINMKPISSAEEICNIISNCNIIIFTIKRAPGTWV
jgi:C-terminal processing protease CtpA/Prc